MIEDVPHRAAFHDPTRVHHHDAVAHLRDDAEVVSDEDQREVRLLLNLAEQAQVLSLDGHVQ